MSFLLIGAALVILLVVFMFLPEGNPGGLRPAGGSRLKNRTAAFMIRRGTSDHRTIEDFTFLDKRIHPSGSQSPEHYNDSFVFQGFDAQQEIGYLTRLGFRDDGALTEVWFWLDIKGKIYFNREQIYTDSPADREGLSKGGVSFTPLGEDRFRISWTGLCEPDGNTIALDFLFSGESPAYLMSSHRDPRGFGMAMAEMKWSREYFETLRSEGADRFEQGGITTGSVRIGEDDPVEVSLKGFRDRSWGKRNWLYIKRYIWNLINLDEPLKIDGKSYTSIIYTTVNYSSTFSHLVSGWAGGPDGIKPISYASDMTRIGEDGTVPRNYETVFRLMGSKETVTLAVKARQGSHSWFVAEDGFEVNETFAVFEVKGKGISGSGMQEFGYRLDSYPRRTDQ
ncbi:MAG: hypothetical protein PQJ58_06210 [Spirochaetales bacterium]|nr:hypothetical protein [Spirochaetales bacterium]